MMDVNIEVLRTYCLEKSGVEEGFPFDESTLVMKVNKKIFASFDLLRPNFIALKCHPAWISELREQYHAIRPAPYYSKAYWNEIELNQDVSSQLLFKLIDHSYNEVLRSLPKKVQLENVRQTLGKNILFYHRNVVGSTMEIPCEIYQHLPESSCCLFHSDLQRAGRGQQGNSWESENGKNLTFSVIISTTFLFPENLFIISKAVSVALVKTLGKYIEDGLSIKWPNDIYWENKKICGILISNELKINRIVRSVIGIGINVNQLVFNSDAPNPVSLAQILGREVYRFALLEDFTKHFLSIIEDLKKGKHIEVSTAYQKRLFRSKNFFRYKDKSGEFEAEIINVADNGCLTLKDQAGSLRNYFFKEVEFVIK